MEPVSFWKRAPDLLALLLVLAGLALIGAGIYYFVNGWRARAFVLLVTASFGTLLVGSGLLIGSDTTRARLAVATAALGLSSVLMLGLCIVLGPHPMILIVFLLTSYGFSISRERLRRRR